MPGKKADKGVKTRKKTKKKELEYLPYVNDIPKFQDPEDVLPKPEITIVYADNVTSLYSTEDSTRNESAPARRPESQ